MFETFLVVDEFEFLQIGSKETHWVRNNNLGFADLDCCFVGVELRVPHHDGHLKISLGPTQFLYSKFHGLLKLIFHQYNGA